jgi:radical SAM protein with 4Fe4S-binding SPASM domain
MLYDHINFLSTASFKRIFNLIKLVLSYYLSIITKSSLVYGYPASISIEPTTLCNLSCPECPSGQGSLVRPAGNMQISLYKKIIYELSPFLLYLNLYFQGEPFLHPEIFKMISLAKQKRIYTAVSTNGHFIDIETSKKIINSGLDKLILCIDAITQEEYEIYRKNGNIKKVITGIKTLINYKKEQKSRKPFIIIQSLIMRHNQYKIKQMKKYFQNLGVDKVLFKSMQINEFRGGNPLIPTINKYSRYKNVGNGNYIIKNKFTNKCWRMWSSTVVTHDGKVIPCCFDKDATYLFGDIIESGLKKIWRNNNYNKFRKKILTGRKDISMCCNCTEGLNKVLFKK